jgi:hypothetical protein
MLKPIETTKPNSTLPVAAEQALRPMDAFLNRELILEAENAEGHTTPRLPPASVYFVIELA